MLGEVAILGAGCICAAGPTLDACLETMLAGKGEPAAPTHFICEQAVTYPVFEVPQKWVDSSSISAGRSANLLHMAVHDALDGVPDVLSVQNELRVGVCIGTSVGASLDFLDFYRSWKAGKKPQLAPILHYLAGNLAEGLAVHYDLSGPCQTVTNACTSGADAIGIAAAWIRAGWCDVAIAGGADALSEISYNGFARLMNTSPEPCRPFDKDRRGLNLGEGAGVLLLASTNVAERFGAPRRGRVAGYGTCGDAYNLTAPHPEARGLLQALDTALGQARITCEDVACVNVHGTGTKANDLVEGHVLRDRFSQSLVFATKGFTGHTLGAAGAMEAAFTLACLERGVLPPSKGFGEPDPAIGLSPVACPTAFSGRFGLSQSLAFGGNNSVLILEKEDRR
ncbi:beta-ketoacyl-[acyl-carrier-protein] synthase family protein [Desulfovibrio sp. Huiquan2017]|uniref:beta-ketoacyl-[acyl-carrier-protein] synthase family protein n=1 Tax=Desulfovibrio sp. Huiquan2017 TaxID=2816861 RepID=UPI001A939897|nr:beta-ketoacyl-[acyl-carrier-protein] synthase family protein [Desulfovibrio sp. Huiquan2017]